MVEFESLEEEIEEYVDVIEESIDVDVDKKSNRSVKRLCQMRNLSTKRA